MQFQPATHTFEMDMREYHCNNDDGYCYRCQRVLRASHYILRAGGMLMFTHVVRMHVVWSVVGVPTKPSAAMEDTSASHMQVGQ